MAPKSRKDRRTESATKRRKQLEELKSKNKKNQQDLKIKKLTRNLFNKDKRGKITTKKKGLSNIPVQERSAPVNKKSKGLSSLGSNYKKQEETLSKKATKKSAKINKARYPEMGTYKGSGTGSKSTKTEKKSKSKTPSGYVRYKGKLVSTRTAQGKNALNRLKAKKRAQEMAKKRLANK